MRHTATLFHLLLLIVLTSLVLACWPAAAPTTSSASSTPATLTLYNAQHEDLVTAMVNGFTQETGIKVNIRSGKDFELANQIVQEGDASPADAFITENSPAMQVVQDKGL